MEYFIRWFSLSLLLSTTACSTIEITTDYDPGVNFNGLSEYKWLPEPTLPQNNRHIDNTVLDKQIRNSVNESLATRGYKLTNNDKPSFLVGYHVALDNKTTVNNVNNYYGYQPAWNANAWRGTTDLGTHSFEQGTLMIDIINAQTNSLVWRATAAAEIDPYASTNTRLERIHKAINKMLGKFPPGQTATTNSEY